MLNLLHIENVAVIERADIEFGPGLNVLTGETGAGKSIIIDSIGAILGERTSRELVRTGSAAAVITAELSLTPPASKWLEENGLVSEDGDGLIIYRRITNDGKNSCRINGLPVNASQLRDLGELLFDIHGQNDGRRLLSEANHRLYLDSFGGLDGLREEYTGLYKAYIAVKNEYDELKKAEADKERREEALIREIEEIQKAKLKEGENEEEKLNERRILLKNSAKITDRLKKAYEAMYGGDESEGALALIISAESSLDTAAKSAEALSGLADSLNDLRYKAEDITEQIHDYLKNLDFSPGELDRIESRLSALNRITRRYGSTDAALKRLKDARNELEDVQYLTEKLLKLKSKLKQSREETVKKAEELSGERKKAAALLEKAIVAELRQLNMPGIRFSVEFSVKSGENGHKFDSSGMDEIRFLMSANAGEELGRLSKIASGGELSRIMLAMKNVLSSESDSQVLIFDEIDTGVSGIAAQRVGEKLSDLAVGRQVLCVTHLSQLAAMADTHFSIEKTLKDGRTYTHVNKLDDDGRRRELARLTGGETITATTLSGAGELIDAARKYKQHNKKIVDQGNDSK
jgi:DNA repair protein RecN (Recombination protein N)